MEGKGKDTDLGPDSCRFIDDFYPLSILTEFSQLKENKQFCDIILQVEDHDFAAHRIVLFGLSPYFKALLSSHFVESSQEKIEIKGFDPKIFELIFNFAYSGSIIITKQNALSLLMAADHFQVLSVKNKVAAFLQDNIDDSNCFEAYCLADMVNCSELKEKTKSYLLRRFTTLYKQNQFLNLTSQLLMNLTSSDELLSDEKTVFEAVYKWYNFDTENRKGEMLEVLKTVRLSLLSPYFLVDIKKQFPIMASCNGVWPLVKETLYSLLLPDREPKIPILKNEFRKMLFDQAGLAIMNDRLWFIADKQIIWQYDPELNQVKQVQKMLFIENTAALTNFDGNLCAAGTDSDEDSSLYYIESYNLRTKLWNVLFKIDKGYNGWTNFAMVAVNKKLHIRDEMGEFFYVCSLDETQTKLTTTREDLLIRKDIALCAIIPYIYIIGGDSQTVERYNIGTGDTEILAPMLNKRIKPGVAARDGKLFVSGGGVDNMEIYDPCLNVWTMQGYPFIPEWPLSVLTKDSNCKTDESDD